jgi:Ca-activated chloride channel family protein
MRTTVFFGVLFPVLNGLTQELAYRAPAPPESRPILRVDTNLVLVPVTVTDSRGAVVPNLNSSDFTLEEEKVRQNVISFSHETAPVSLGILVDLSGSMKYKIDKVRVAVEVLLHNMEPEDEEFLVTFADRPQLRWPFTSDTSAIRAALSFSEPHGYTALFDAIALAAQQMRGAHNRRRVLFLISDGGDNYSRLTKRELRRLLDEEDVQIHAIGIHDHAMTREEVGGPWILEDLAKITGGRHHMVENTSDLPTLAAQMSLALHDRYLIGYRPTPPGASGKFRRIDVRLVQRKNAGKLYVYARRGYWMP